MHPSLHYYENSLSNGVKYYFNQIGLKKKIRPVNRLDKDTTGIVIFAKNEYVQENLVRQMATGKFEKEYVAILEGILDKKQGTIDAPISRKENSIIERIVSPDGEKSITHYSVLKEYSSFSLVSFKLETGRTHQIRVHSKYIGHPILGDSLYGSPSTLISHQALHAYRITFSHPITHKQVICTSPLPEDMQIIL